MLNLLLFKRISYQNIIKLNDWNFKYLVISAKIANLYNASARNFFIILSLYFLLWSKRCKTYHQSVPLRSVMLLQLVTKYLQTWNFFSFYILQKLRILGEESDPPGSDEHLWGPCKYTMKMISANVGIVELR